MNVIPLPEIYSTAISASIEASQVIMEVYASDIQPSFKADGSPVTVADLRSSEIISAYLEKTSIPVTGEEREKTDYSVRKEWNENWSVDPLDGTKMFLQKNGEFSVNIAHIVNKRPVFGIITSPVNQEILFGGPKYGVFVVPFDRIGDSNLWTQILPTVTTNDPLVVACSRSFKGLGFPIVDELHLKYGELSYLKKGSALKFFDLAKGTADLYLRFGPTMEWT